MHFCSVIVNSLLQRHIERPNASRDEMHFLLGRHFPDHEQIRVPDLIRCLSEGEFDEGIDIVKLSMLVMKHNFLWGTDARTVVPTGEINFVDRNMDGFNAFSWGAYLFKQCLHRWKHTLPERETKHINLGGFSYALLVFAFEVVPDIALLTRRRSDTAHLPHICHWEFTGFLNYPKMADAKEAKLFSSQASSITWLKSLNFDSCLSSITGKENERQRGYYADLDKQNWHLVTVRRKKMWGTTLLLMSKSRRVIATWPETFMMMSPSKPTPRMNGMHARKIQHYSRRVRPPEGDHEALVPMVRVDETSLVLIPPLQRHNIELREQVTELREQVTELRGQVTEL
ncbi:Probable rhamnose biosynthetic enzyme 2 [Olea europaea subsp. europaea]|uniref:Probable rhamnose biosynthetic enzyme 2 n=1 Tax=Olea europaea subsp. europaea TaxID=158383 RepID=A0A8S0SD25_OLEEU|nr:Probable rhamnose biosynthetic enzyme 2 [Olea europaea subsp. europaea]